MSRIPNDELHTEKIVYETYFGEMEISDEEKKERLELAKELEPIFISFFYAFLEQEGNEGDFIQSLSGYNYFPRCIAVLQFNLTDRNTMSIQGHYFQHIIVNIEQLTCHQLIIIIV